MRNRWWATTAFAVATLAVAACGSSGSGGGSSSSAGSSGSSTSSGTQAASTTSVVKTAKIGNATVLTNSKGLTLYTFAIDPMNKSKCTGQCAHFWPPVKGPVKASGIKGTFATIKRSDGSTQATWNGHPLYTYIGDTAPGQAKGNGLNLSGGVWHEVLLAGAAAPAPAQSSSSSGGGGYGY
jgi:predicted lipoprotein with Yx(FWY)xxD motif